MISIRLEAELEQQLEQLSQQQQVPKSHLVREALANYFAKLEQERLQQTPFQMGQDIFGKYASGESDRSSTYKQRIKGKLRGKNTD